MVLNYSLIGTLCILSARNSIFAALATQSVFTLATSQRAVRPRLKMRPSLNENNLIHCLVDVQKRRAAHNCSTTAANSQQSVAAAQVSKCSFRKHHAPRRRRVELAAA